MSENLFDVNEEVSSTPEHMNRALDTAIVTAGKVLGISPKYPYRFKYSDDERDAGFVPRLEHTGSDEFTNIIIARDWLNEYIGDFCVENPDITNLDMLKVAVASAVIPDMFLEKIDPHDKTKVDNLYVYFSTPNYVNKLLADDLLYIGPIEKHLREEVLSWPEEKICELNRLRLVVGALYYNESDAGQEPVAHRQQVDMAPRVRGAFRDKFKNMNEVLENYTSKVGRMFKIDEGRATRHFTSEITPLEIALAYPMGYAELSKYAEALYKK